MFRTVPLSNIRSFTLCTQQRYMSHTFVDSLRAVLGRNQFRPDPAVSKPVWHTPLLCVYSEKLLMMTEKLSETCRVLFQNKFEKLVHLVGFIMGIYHEARSSERQIYFFLSF